MLTSDLVKVRFRKDQAILPFVPSEDADLLKMAQTLIHVVQNHSGRPRWELEDTLKEIYGNSPQLLLYRGLVKLLQDRCEFEVKSEKQPFEIRAALFLEANRLRQEKQGLSQREEVFQTVSQKLQMDRIALEEGLYADLREQQRLITFKFISPKNLLERYNVSLVQTVLFRAVQLHLSFPSLSPQRKRQFFRYLKFHQLLYTLLQQHPFEIQIDGPLSLFSSSQKYGFQMALFLPVVLHNTEWKLKAELLWGPQKLKKNLVLTESSGLRSHTQDIGQYIPVEILEFKERFNQKYDDWKAEIAEEYLELDSHLFIPDFTFTHHASQEKIYLEVYGYWRRSSLLSKWQSLKKNLGERVLIAVQKKLQVDEEAPLLDHLYFFQTALIPREIYKRLQERLPLLSSS
jgi:predicted nuclease of restriction endonuclease-like RecB superfamily